MNNSKQERLGLSPNEILSHPELNGQVFERKYAKRLRNVTGDVSGAKFKVNQLVRLVPFVGPTPFQKVYLARKAVTVIYFGYFQTPINSLETFRVYQVFASTPPTYALKDSQNRIVDKTVRFFLYR